ncbi:helix-turn-helix domain-containing protein [Pseudomonas aeruginosa]|jgi:transcriptional regulator with XRE-family HTH domain|uniref:helix-turn-helix domain-containing protein n=2 Tax=Pseudomonadota TaxID=1224 RepID=UPI00053ECC22|nr:MULTISPECIES: helix-turn-helix domain-containing protein [Pseudomonadota]MBH9070677.1 helix-turn-helix domain-containing protein [Pseudomonas aeruginosa]MBV6265930.1 helix-turn-helix domain-containing protein [Pseudomonas aeruginosa]MBV6325920.1 helix-turn-helix domain-containing protein [Pseudomonas aeruginosa]MDI3608514.1 helix-turn-helix domain-containing protein [Pseudomonas aeruginosa]MDI3675191.1 helix-turn-helix domain-containing protein [Pseudomonas aeruginosa]
MSSSEQKRSGAQVAMPQPVARALRRLGQDISAARRMRRLSQEDLAQRIGTSLSTVRRMEDGYPGTALHTFLRALHVLGRLDDLAQAMTLENDALGMELVREQLPQRVRTSAGRKRQAASVVDKGDARTPADDLEGF